MFYKTALYDEIHEQNRSRSEGVIDREFCYAYDRLKSDKRGGKVEASYKLFDGGASYSAEQLERLGIKMCDKSYSSDMSDANRELFKKEVSAEGRKIG